MQEQSVHRDLRNTIKGALELQTLPTRVSISDHRKVIQNMTDASALEVDAEQKKEITEAYRLALEYGMNPDEFSIPIRQNIHELDTHTFVLKGRQIHHRLENEEDVLGERQVAILQERNQQGQTIKPGHDHIVTMTMPPETAVILVAQAITLEGEPVTVKEVPHG
jgi:hypothetical protein